MSYLNDIKQRIKGRLKIRELYNYGVGYLADTPQGLFVVDPRDQFVSRGLLEYGGWATSALKLLSTLINKNSTVVFIGPHIGTLLVPIAKRSGQVFGYEADPGNFNYLKYNVMLNHLENATLYNLAVGDRDAEVVSLVRDVLNSGHTSIRFGNDLSDENIQMVSLDSHLKIDSSVRLMVMDIEGSEVHAIRGMQNTLKNVDILYTEFSNSFISLLGDNCYNFAHLLKNHFRHMVFFGENKQICYRRHEWVDVLSGYDDIKDEIIVDLLFTNEERILDQLLI
jgi:FkbM family methyltransferase